MQSIKKAVLKCIYKNLDSPEEIIDLFLKNVIRDFKALLHPTIRKSNVVSPFKDMVFKNKTEKTERFLESYNTLANEKALEWVDISDMVVDRPKSINLKNILIQRILSFEQNFISLIQDMGKKSEEFVDMLDHITEQHEFSDKDTAHLKVLRDRLQKLVKLTYKEFMDGVKEGNILEI